MSADRPVTYLYNTLHYYERHLRDRTNLKRKLVHAIMSSLKVNGSGGRSPPENPHPPLFLTEQDNRTPGWCLSETYLKFGMNPREDNVWIPDDTYYCKLIGRLVDNILHGSWAADSLLFTLQNLQIVNICLSSSGFCFKHSHVFGTSIIHGSLSATGWETRARGLK